MLRFAALLLPCGLLAACLGPLGVPGSYGPSAAVLDSAVRSIYHPEAPQACAGAQPCPGPVPPEHVRLFRSELARQGIPPVEPGRAAPLLIAASHVAASAMYCTVEGTVTTGERTIALTETYHWPPGRFQLARDAADRAVIAPAARDAVLDSCLVSFAKSVGMVLRQHGYFGG